MAEEQFDSAEVKTPFFSGKIAGKNLTLRDIVLLLVFGGVIYSGVTIYTHADAQDKNNSALLREIKESNRQTRESNQQQTQTLKNVAFYQCKAACLLRFDQKDRDRGNTDCELQCAPIKQ